MANRLTLARYFLNLTRTQATGAYAHPFCSTGGFNAHPLEIRIPAASRMIVRVADIVAVYRSFSTHFAASGHSLYPHRIAHKKLTRK